MIKHCLFYEFGSHSVVVEVSEEDFFKVIDDLSKEFEIIRFQSLNDLEYRLINYLGDYVTVGFVYEREVL